MKKIIFIIILIFSIIPVYSQWSQQNSGTANNLTSINFINENTGVCVGLNSTILKTTNSGINWSIISSPVQADFDYVKMFSSGDIIIGSLVSNTILKSTDCGVTFECIVVNIPSYETKLKVYFVNYLTGYFLTGTNIYKTNNGGLNWSSINTYLGNRDIAFSDENTWYLCGRYTIPYPPPYGTSFSEIRKTTNSGSNWVVLVSIQELSYSIYRIFFINNNTGFFNAYSSSSLSRTINGGNTWDAGVYGAGNYKNYYNFSFPDLNTGWFIGDQIIKSTNGGLNWTTMSTQYGSNFKGIFFLNNLTGWMVSNGGLIIKTTTGGITGITPISSQIPKQFSLSQNYPNPFNPYTKIKFNIPLSRGVDAGGGRGVLTKLSVYDILGREVATLVNQQLQPGTYEVDWVASVYPSGVYFYSIYSGEFTETKKMELIK